MSLSRNTLIIGALSAGLVAALVVIIVLAAGGDGGDKSQALAAPPTAAVTATALATATAQATAVTTSTSVPPSPPPPPPAPPAPPPPEPTPRTCVEIRADPVYRTDAERDFFIRNCTSAPVPAATSRPGGAPQPTTAPAPAGQSAEERAYVSRASSVIGYYTARLAQYWGTPSYGALSDLYELAAVALGNANDLDNTRPVPDRFRAAHDGYIRALLALHDQIVPGLNFVTNLQQFLAWEAGFERRVSDTDAALRNYLQVTGIQAPQLGGLR